MKINPRETGLIELVCAHGVGHPSEKLTRAAGRRWSPVDSTHGCDGCCATQYFRKREGELTGEARSMRRTR